MRKESRFRPSDLGEQGVRHEVKHKALTSVDLSANGIGSMVFHPLRGHSGATPSVRALADCMRYNMVLEELDLSWNSLSGEHVLPVMDALDENRSITSLNLAWNGLGNEGAVPLGMAVRLNVQRNGL